MKQTYHYGSHRELTPQELFFLIAIDETCKQLGVEDVGAVAAILAGQNWIPTRAKFAGATKNTSLASIGSRALLNYNIKYQILPTLTNASVKQMKFFFVRNIGTFVGRAIPVVGWAVAAHDVYAIATNSVARFNRLVNREDRLFTR
ncbi:hypothetical protein WL76_09155 [Burkholderia ubonensis]|uniref:Phage membrane protein n=2 Tax=Burkholderia ubonensis TaxID=101571 RepID=A0A119NJ88_9BURK|nr:hypothetical protein [Burkholderia ubonensis]AOJ63941.1 hypothetical protein WJ32_16680 [Burkholderia ubonensis]KVG56174.1 hypothetical protein WJ33_05010 [Burkholderia ubonensis]KVM61259.1 hypothetical protein WJ58_05045 [Burkholderia ubonensis]KWE57862.1 hypothetical protein WL76_09155 [Burkholderia ubonensis]